MLWFSQCRFCYCKPQYCADLYTLWTCAFDSTPQASLHSSHTLLQLLFTFLGIFFLNQDISCSYIPLFILLFKNHLCARAPKCKLKCIKINKFTKHCYIHHKFWKSGISKTRTRKKTEWCRWKEGRDELFLHTVFKKVLHNTAKVKTQKKKKILPQKHEDLFEPE